MQRGLRAALVGVAAIAVLAIATGCGDSSDDSGQALTKAQYVKKSFDICGRALDKRDVLLEDAFALVGKDANGELELSEAAEERLVTSVALPPVREAIGKLSELTPPDGDEDTVDSIVENFEKAIEKVEEDPGSVLGSSKSNPFDQPLAEAKKYGLQRCSELS